MCATCGCGDASDAHDDEHEHSHVLPDGTVLRHRHAHESGPSRLIAVERDILAKNDHIAAYNRGFLAARGTLCLNLVASPGAGKTTLLERTLADLRGEVPLAVIEGDQQTDLDAARIRATGVPAVQVNTGKGCHLDAAMVRRALARLDPPERGVLLIENVGNLVCPAGFDLGEAAKVVLASVTEGEDKPLKYPDMFAASTVMLVSKADLLPHLDFDVTALVANARRVNPGIEVFVLSARTGEGMAAWYGWLRARLAQAAEPVV